MLAYALTIFTGAFLLFQVQPIIGKYILPWFGGTPGVWTTCLLFFQTVLLGGYAYAHLSTKYLRPKQQAWLHIGLLLGSLALLPIIPSDAWKPHAGADPTLRILALLAVNLGLPYLILSATGPLIQKWCSETEAGILPYRLYALSNAGSLLALLSYPFFFEWEFTRRAQAHLWAGGMAFFALLCGICAWRMARRAPDRQAASAALGPATPTETVDLSARPGNQADAVEEGAPVMADRMLWLGLPMLASILLLATTNKLCQDLAVTPFLWVLPLSLYLLSFILCFDSPRWYLPWFWSFFLFVGVSALACILVLEDNDIPILLQVLIYSVALFSGCMLCHGELYRLRPHPRHLTAYYLVISAGGAMGGFLVAIVAPLVLHSFLELQYGFWALTAVAALCCFRGRSHGLAVGACAGAWVGVFVAAILSAPMAHAFRPEVHNLRIEIVSLWKDYPWAILGLAAGTILGFGQRYRWVAGEWRHRSGLFLVAASAAFAAIFCLQIRESAASAVSASRNFFGVLTVFDYSSTEDNSDYHLLLHGRIIHGLQFTDRKKSAIPTTYYAPSSGVGRAIDGLPQNRGRRLGLVGLGTGTLAAYGRPADYLRIYEINPRVPQIARSWFTYLAHSPAKVDIVMGDARLSMESEALRGDFQAFDVLALDAFNSDAIPVHLLTQEAFATYLRHLKSDGIIAVHISNRYFDLEPVVRNLARRFRLACVTVDDDEKDDWWVYDTTWMLLSRDPAALKRPGIKEVGVPPSKAVPGLPLWTDDYTSVFKILR